MVGQFVSESYERLVAFEEPCVAAEAAPSRVYAAFVYAQATQLMPSEVRDGLLADAYYVVHA